LDRSASGSSFASASFVSAQEMMESALESPSEKGAGRFQLESPSEKVAAFNPPGAGDGGESLTDVNARMYCTRRAGLCGKADLDSAASLPG
jgi:hypothetical protein